MKCVSIKWEYILGKCDHLMWYTNRLFRCKKAWLCWIICYALIFGILSIWYEAKIKLNRFKAQRYSNKNLTWACTAAVRCKSIRSGRQVYDANLSIMYTFVDDFSHNDCQLINKENTNWKLCLLCASKCLQTEINRRKKPTRLPQIFFKYLSDTESHEFTAHQNKSIHNSSFVRTVFSKLIANVQTIRIFVIEWLENQTSWLDSLSSFVAHSTFSCDSAYFGK